VRYRTNVSDSRNKGLEAFAELDWMKLIKKDSKHKLSTFVNFSYIDARYVRSTEKAYNNKKVEYAPNIIVRSGISYAYKKLSFTLQHSYTAQQFSEATNSTFSPAAIYGIIPAYMVMDLSAGYSWKIYGVSAGINNLTNSKYFTRRAEGYPGPGIIPGDPFNMYVTLRLKF
jgi:Fe(3+) dicitrate transport protein